MHSDEKIKYPMPIRAYKMVTSLPQRELEYWQKLLDNSMKNADRSRNFPVGHVFFALATSHHSSTNYKCGIIAYGAGAMAKEYVPKVGKNVDILECWDMYSSLKNLGNIPVVRPKDSAEYIHVPIVIFIDDARKRSAIENKYSAMGYESVYYFRDYIEIISLMKDVPEILTLISDETYSVFDEFLSSFTYIEDKTPQINYGVLPNKLKDELVACDLSADVIANMREKFESELFCKEAPEKFSEALDLLENIKAKNIFQVAYNVETFLRCLLRENIKTKKRPLRMADDSPHDAFAIFSAMRIILESLFSVVEALRVSKSLREVADNSAHIVALECCFLLQCNQCDEALRLSRDGMVQFPNSLLMNEMFVCVATECKKRGVAVDEPLPNYDLSERFCWSGFSFAWCGGFDKNSKEAIWGPCFRPLQCAAMPTGDFWTSEDWTEFRKSILDGSFRYCQKNQCPNIVAGWLPKKSDCADEVLCKIFNGDFTEQPELTELHLSYDAHCNLACPSCRTEIRTNSREDVIELDELFEKNIRPYLQNLRHLCLSGCGEAILSPHSKKILQSLSTEKYPQMKVELRTNGTVLTDKVWKSLGEGSNVIKHIAISIDAASKELFEKLRYPAKWERVMKNLDFISDLRRKEQIKMLEFHVVVQEENLNELMDIVKLAIKKEADAVTFSKIINWRGMPGDEYIRRNPFFYNNPHHKKLNEVINDIIRLRNDIENGRYKDAKKKIFINMHFVPDPNSSYDFIRSGNFKIR